MKKGFVLVVLILLMAAPYSNAQLWKIRRLEVMAGLGTTQFFGDVGGYTIGENLLGLKDITYLQTRYNLNGNIKYRFTQNINGRFSLTYGRLHATDIRGSNEGRGMAASSSFFEPAALGEYYFIKNKSENLYTFVKRGKTVLNDLLASIDLYVFTGIGAATYNVKPNEKLSSNPRFVKSGAAAVLPLGIGMNLIYSSELNFGLEMGGRYVFGDYLDGYTSQYSRANDVYYLFNLTATYKLWTKVDRFPVIR